MLTFTLPTIVIFGNKFFPVLLLVLTLLDSGVLHG